MSCCGNQRGMLPPIPIPAPRTERGRPALPGQAIQYEYVGATGMTVVGPITGQRYRFAAYGSRLAIDPRDAPSMVTVPHVRRVS